MRKESIGRLLLSFITAFVMVVGVFTAAVYNNAVDWESQNVPGTPDMIAPSEPDKERSEVGEAPTSAYDRLTNTNNQITNERRISNIDGLQYFTKDQKSHRHTTSMEEKREQSISSMPEEHGTRPAPGAYVDAGGPYGTPSDPMEEGDATVFWATIYDDDPLNYEYRWDINDDGNYETEWSSDPFYFHTFTDDHIGEARVQAFDGSGYWITDTGIPLDEDTNIYEVWTWGGYSSITWGYEFDISQEIRITDLGFYRDPNIWGWLGPAPEYVYKMTIWDAESWSRLVELEDPNGFPYIDYVWNWFSVSPAYTLTPGTYMVSYNTYTGGAYENACPGVQHPGTSPDGIVAINNRYVAEYDAYPYMDLGSWSCPSVDFKYEYDEFIEEYLEDTADVFVENVAPDVYDCTSIPPDALAPEGSPVEFTAKFKDPGVDDVWVFRYTWGDGEATDWIKVPKYKFDVPVNNVLYYCDWDTGDYGRQALNDMGLSFTDVGSNENGLVDELESGVEWDLVLVQNPNYYWSESTLDALNDFVLAGGKLIYETWNMGHYSWHDLWYNLGAYWGGDYYSTQTIYEWDTTHDIFNSPNVVPSVMHPTNDYMGIDGHWIEPTWNANPVCGYSPTYNPWWYDTGIAARLDGQTVFHSFVWSHYQGDEDGDGMDDMLELIINEICWLLGGEAVQPWPDPIELPAYPHIFKDDHPNTLTDMDQFNVRIEVMDDDHSPDWVPSTPALGDYLETEFWPELTWLEEPSGGYGDSLSLYDDHALEVDIGFDFYYYGQDFDSIYVCSNGFLDFNDEHVEYWMSGIPQGGDFDNTLYPMWTDLNPSESWANVYTMTIDDPVNPGYQIFVVTYDNVPHYWIDGSYNFQIWLRQADFTITFNYKWIDPLFDYTNTIGIEGPSTSWFVESFVGTYPPSYMSREYRATKWNPAKDPVDGLDTDDCWVTIQNVFPELYKPAEFVEVVKESGEVHFGVTDEWGFTITDPALKAESENFWYKIDYGDGTVAEWQKTQQLIPGLNMGNLFVTGIPMDFPLQNNYAIDGAQRLMYNYLMFCFGDTGTVLCSDSSWYMQSYTPDSMEDTLNNNFGTNYDFIYDDTGTPLVAGGVALYDMLYFSYDYDDLGALYTADEVLEFMMAGGHVFVPGDEYLNGPIYFLPYYVENQVSLLADFPGPAYTGWVEDIISDSVTTGFWGFYYALHSILPDYDPWEFLPIYADPSPTTTLIRVGGDAYSPKNLILPETHIYGDNGIYEVNIMIIDDDMWWDLSGEQPEFMGTGDPNDWISHNRFEVEIENTDPVISPDVRAYAQLDLRLRISGTKDTDATMTLYETVGDETTVLGTASVTRDPGSPDIGIMPSVDLMMTKDYEYELVVAVTGGSGGNPTWIFDMVFPDGKYKEFKHTFNDEHGWTWTITNSELKAALLGHDIIFEATAEDSGSDDLAFVWNFGDCTPYGIHLYANDLFDPALPPDPLNGESDEAEVMFTQLGIYADPWFEYDANDERSPELKPIEVTDVITHIFDEDQPYYYYVTLIVMDDDVGEPYPSTQLHPTSGLDYYHLEIALG